MRWRSSSRDIRRKKNQNTSLKQNAPNAVDRTNTNGSRIFKQRASRLNQSNSSTHPGRSIKRINTLNYENMSLRNSSCSDARTKQPAGREDSFGAKEIEVTGRPDAAHWVGLETERNGSDSTQNPKTQQDDSNNGCHARCHARSNARRPTRDETEKKKKKKKEQ
ncbi:hypothetical protein VTN31DRAFT_7023 [Thermomyces dupontii]|uniref:uncharacterized protein n=1 Tax=Talaromyces thermophilus TaxID=28565 RepID=UPI00374493B3